MSQWTATVPKWRCDDRTSLRFHAQRQLIRSCSCRWTSSLFSDCFCSASLWSMHMIRLTVMNCWGLDPKALTIPGVGLRVFLMEVRAVRWSLIQDFDQRSCWKVRDWCVYSNLRSGDVLCFILWGYVDAEARPKQAAHLGSQPASRNRANEMKAHLDMLLNASCTNKSFRYF